jgi:1-acyl-sn-glycerol-3-phosphate acyltransferase
MSFSLQRAWYQLCRWFCRAYLTFANSLESEGNENVPAQGPFLLVANHQSYFDPPAVGACLGRNLFYLARKSLWNNRLFGALLTSVNSLPVDQESRFVKDAMKSILARFDEGEGVLFFPEGTRSLDGNMSPLQPGILFLLKYLRAPIPVIPVGLAGFYEAWPMHNKYPRFSPLFFPARDRGTLAVSFGKPIDSAIYQGMDRKAILDDLARRIQSQRERAEVIRRKPTD